MNLYQKIGQHFYTFKKYCKMRDGDNYSFKNLKYLDDPNIYVTIAS